MAKGSIAKEAVAAKIASIFGKDWVGKYDNKYYVWSYENGERIQVSIALTCPKNPVGEIIATTDDGGIDFDALVDKQAAPTTFSPAEITQEEKDNIENLMKALNL